MAATICVLGLTLSSYPYLRSAMLRFPLPINLTFSLKLNFLKHGGDSDKFH